MSRRLKDKFTILSSPLLTSEVKFCWLGYFPLISDSPFPSLWLWHSSCAQFSSGAHHRSMLPLGALKYISLTLSMMWSTSTYRHSETRLSWTPLNKRHRQVKQFPHHTALLLQSLGWILSFLLLMPFRRVSWKTWALTQETLYTGSLYVIMGPRVLVEFRSCFKYWIA